MVAGEGKEKEEKKERRERKEGKGAGGEEGRGLRRKAEEWERESPAAETPNPPQQVGVYPSEWPVLRGMG